MDTKEKANKENKWAEEAFGLCNCGQRNRYSHFTTLDDGTREEVMSCNKYVVCATYEQLQDRLAETQHELSVAKKVLDNITVRLAKEIEKRTGIESRATVLGHIQRGGSPSADDRILATRLGAKAVEFLIAGQTDKMAGVVDNDIKAVDLTDAIKKRKVGTTALYRLIRILAM